MVRLDKLTQRSQDALQYAHELAESNNNSQIEVEHLLLALLEQEESLSEIILSQMGVDVKSLKEKLKDEISVLPKMYATGQAPQIYVSPALNKVFDSAWREAQALKDEYVSVEHILIAIAESKESKAGKMLQGLGVSKDKIYQVLTKIRGSQRVTDQDPESKYQVLEKYSRDLTELAKKGEVRSGHRQGGGDKKGNQGFVSPHQEQSGFNRRARSGKNCHRRGIGNKDS